ncbi:hypothetical protein CMI48_01145 [Candidatus Pacearchaeota archaeon]|jgi:hypothetical protein|nr:hypothetical protein [Candidatus Pacearchaeota archaeon]|tara:strand:- start:596 stop:904 length:309 start_codon:yes stop_codon:yes gene_type:complete
MSKGERDIVCYCSREGSSDVYLQRLLDYCGHVDDLEDMRMGGFFLPNTGFYWSELGGLSYVSDGGDPSKIIFVKLARPAGSLLFDDFSEEFPELECRTFRED